MQSTVRRWITENLLVSFFLLAFGYTWLFQILMVLLSPSNAGSLAFYIPSIYGPTIGAIALCLIMGGFQRLSEFLRRSLFWRVNVIWYLIALFGIAFILLLVRFTHGILFPTLSIPPVQLPTPIFSLFSGFLTGLVLGPFAEELGWRGFALPLLQRKVNALTASLLLGVIWWAWHLPQLLLSELQWAVGGMPIFLYLLMIVPGSILATWIFNNTNGSVLLTILFHGSLNFSMGLLAFNSPNFIVVLIAFLWVAAILVTIIFGPKYLSRREVDFSGRP